MVSLVNDDSGDFGGTKDDEDRHDFQAFVRSSLAKLVEGQQQMELNLAASIEFNSERIVKLEKSYVRN